MKLYKIISLCFLVVMAFFFFSCGSKEKGVEYMLSVEQDQHLNLTNQINEFEVSSHFRSAKYLAIREAIKHGSSETDTSGLGSIIHEYEKGVYFEVRLSLKNKENIILYNVGNQSDYAVRVDYLNNGIYNDFYILQDDFRKIKPIGHSFQNTFGAGVFCDLTLVFPSEVLNGGNNIELIYKDRVFGIGDKVRFLYPVKYLN